MSAVSCSYYNFELASTVLNIIVTYFWCLNNSMDQLNMISLQPTISADSVQDRYNLDVEMFARNFNLCEPTLGNFFLAKHDAYVLIVLARLG